MTLFLVPEPCTEGQPSGKQSLLDIYGLRDFANSVARQDPETGAKRKLRKSYKNHIADLPGKHPVPGPGETTWTLVDAAIRAQPPNVDDSLRSLDYSAAELSKIKFQKSINPIPNFDPKLLAAPGVNSGKDASNTASPQPTASPRASSPGFDDHFSRLEKRKRKELAASAEKRRKV